MANKKLEKFRKALERTATIAEEIDLIGIREAAEIRGVTQSAITQLCTRGRIESVNVFGHPWMLREDVVNYKKGKRGPKVTE